MLPKCSENVDMLFERLMFVIEKVSEYTCALEVQPPLFYRLVGVPNHHFLSKGLSSSKMNQGMHIIWVVPLPSNSDHQDYYIFSRESL